MKIRFSHLIESNFLKFIKIRLKVVPCNLKLLPIKLMHMALHPFSFLHFTWLYWHMVWVWTLNVHCLSWLHTDFHPPPNFHFTQLLLGNIWRQRKMPMFEMQIGMLWCEMQCCCKVCAWHLNNSWFLFLHGMYLKPFKYLCSNFLFFYFFVINMCA
jgi:hypothetical protein